MFSNFKLVSLHLKLIDYFIGDSSDEFIKIKIGFSLTCLYMWLIQVVYCGIVGLPNVSIICSIASTLYLITLYILKKSLISTTIFSRLMILTSIIALHLCYLNAGAYLNPTIIWLMTIPVFAITLSGLKEGAVWSIFSSVLSIVLMEVYHQSNWTFNEWSTKHIYDVGQSNLFNGPLLFFLMFGFYYYSRNKLQRDLEEVTHEKNRLLNILFHDIGRNTNLLANYMELSAQEKPLTGHLKRSYELADEIRQIIINSQQLNEYQYQTDAKSIDIQTLYIDTREKYEYDLKRKGIHLKPQIANGLKIKANPSQFQSHIIDNLISNAIKFSNSNSEIIFKADRYKNKTSIHIIDNGIGHNDGELREGTAGEKGSGKGLSIVNQFAKLNNLEFSIYQQSSGGTISCIREM